MMKSESTSSAFQKLFPSTFSIAIVLSVITFLLALLFTEPILPANGTDALTKEALAEPLANSPVHLLQIAGYWYAGMWNTGMLAFCIQMMLILVLGYVLAATAFFQKLISTALRLCRNTASSALVVALFTLLISLFNWGLGLILGALFARKVGTHFQSTNQKINYPLIGAAGYAGLMIWHGGLSGSAPLKAAEAGHLQSLTGINTGPIGFDQTIFSDLNIFTNMVLLITIPALMFYLGKRYPGRHTLPPENLTTIKNKSDTDQITGAEKIDHNKSVSFMLGLAILLVAFARIIKAGGIEAIDPNFLNFSLLGLALLLSKNIHTFLTNIKNAMGSASDILIQFPLYFGIMGIMKYSGLVEIFSGLLMEVSNQITFPIFTFISAGLVNIFVPSGGGQWAIQGPIIMEAAQNLGIPLGKAIMALAYGDQVTNMLQPFWALPLLGITGLKAKQIMPYTLLLLALGLVVFIAGLLVF